MGSEKIEEIKEFPRDAGGEDAMGSLDHAIARPARAIMLAMIANAMRERGRTMCSQCTKSTPIRKKMDASDEYDW